MLKAERWEQRRVDQRACCLADKMAARKVALMAVHLVDCLVALSVLNLVVRTAARRVAYWDSWLVGQWACHLAEHWVEMWAREMVANWVDGLVVL